MSGVPDLCHPPPASNWFEYASRSTTLCFHRAAASCCVNPSVVASGGRDQLAHGSLGSYLDGPAGRYFPPTIRSTIR